MSYTHTQTDLPAENEYPKLVRDKIPELIKADGIKPVIHVASTEEYVRFLLAKIVEEANELRYAKDTKHQLEEVADVREVLESLLEAFGVSEEEISKIQKSKANARGGFKARLILDKKPV